MPSGSYNYREQFNENININTGALSITDKVVSLKGKAGLDLNLEFVYDSSTTSMENVSSSEFNIYSSSWTKHE